MKLSIITATYNSAATVADTLASVAGQTYPQVEHVIVDGLSKDNTLVIVADFPHVAQVHSGKDKGIYDAMNKGLDLATGEVIGILNSDDVYAHHDVLQKVMACFQDASVDAVYADLQYVAADDLNRVIRTWRSGQGNARSFYYGWMPPHPTFFVRRRVYDQMGNFNLELRSAADYELMLRAFVKHQIRVQYIPEILVKMRAGGMSNASLKNRLRANKEDRRAWEINGIQPYFFTTYLKPLRKITQFLIRK
jgi:glycosyltransferase involved in cell wall biosynthesis